MRFFWFTAEMKNIFRYRKVCWKKRIRLYCHGAYPQAAAGDPGLAAYAGALEPTDKNDTGKHGFIRGEISERGTRFEFVPLAKREYLHLVLETESRMGNAEVRN